MSSPWDRAALCGVDASGENIAWGNETPQDVMSGWIWSPGHNVNMLDGGYTRVGEVHVRLTFRARAPLR